MNLHRTIMEARRTLVDDNQPCSLELIVSCALRMKKVRLPRCRCHFHSAALCQLPTLSTQALGYTRVARQTPVTTSASIIGNRELLDVQTIRRLDKRRLLAGRRLPRKYINRRSHVLFCNAPSHADHRALPYTRLTNRLRNQDFDVRLSCLRHSS